MSDHRVLSVFKRAGWKNTSVLKNDGFLKAHYKKTSTHKSLQKL